ncbi:MAG: hypothetical protein OEW99_01610 [Gammaproteobacteria bacterium]|nr:hypothetical protein [Gammaproteobacteria bacterium]MDH5659787.1 hypothetical protein [Gammaproteobacteria bacterium]
MLKSIFIKYNFLALLVISSLLTGCPDSTPSKTIAELNAAPEEIFIDGQNYNLSTYLWRDFMPPSTGSDLMTVIKVSERNLLTIPDNISVTYLWVINGTEVWSTEFTDEAGAGTPAYVIEKIARGGPKWDTGINVDVIVQIFDGSGTEYLLRASAQLIHQTS